MPNERCPWYLSARAVSEFARLLHLDPEKDEDFDRAEDLLTEVAREARFERNQANGLQLWLSMVPLSERTELMRRGKHHRKPDYRLQLLISTEQRAEGNLPQLVRVLRRWSQPKSS